jgi:hypothetical protein
MTKEEERAIIDEMICIFMEDDDFDIYMKEQIEKGKTKKFHLLINQFL